MFVGRRRRSRVNPAVSAILLEELGFDAIPTKKKHVRLRRRSLPEGVSKTDEVLWVNGDDAESGAINIGHEEKGDGDDDWHYKSDALWICWSYIEANHHVTTNSDGPTLAPNPASLYPVRTLWVSALIGQFV
jgi:hypothetical protein